MRRYNDTLEVRRGMVPGVGGVREEGPEQFLWRGRLWKVSGVLAHWVETGAWWRRPDPGAVRAAAASGERGSGFDPGGTGGTGGTGATVSELTAEREVWRVEAAPGRVSPGRAGVFDLVFDWTDGSWRLVGCAD